MGIVDFSLDNKSGVPYYRQIIEQVKYGISRRELQPGRRRGFPLLAPSLFLR